MLPVLMAALTVAAITVSPAASYAQMVRFGQIDHTPSAEILKLHAGNAATMEEALSQPDLPAFVMPRADGASWFTMEPLPDRLG